MTTSLICFSSSVFTTTLCIAKVMRDYFDLPGHLCSMNSCAVLWTRLAHRQSHEIWWQLPHICFARTLNLTFLFLTDMFVLPPSVSSGNMAFVWISYVWKDLEVMHIYLNSVPKKRQYRPLCFQISARLLFSFSVNASLSTWARLVFRWGTPAGSSTAWNMVSSQTARCQATSLWEATMTRSQPSSVRPGLGSTSPERSSLTWNPLSLVWIIILLSFHGVMRWVK